ncbi:MAG: hypothetical protein K2O38_04820 [Muribaculaceae bacterium]|nr:hypothetical protein [Muribaculaceae bacterium]
MRLHIIKRMAAGAMALSALAASAQSRSAYFLDNYTYNFQHNPAMAIDRRGDISFPLFGNLNVGTSANVGLKTFFFKGSDGRLMNFMNPQVNTNKFLSGIKNHNRIGLEMREQIMSVGFRALGGYNHISVGVVGDAQIRMPKSIFSFLKEGISNRTYDIGRIDANAHAYTEIALNHSHSLENLLPGLRVGGTFKFLIGFGNVDINFDKADLRLGKDEWNAITNGTMRVNIPGVRLLTHTNDEGREYVDDFEYDSFSIGGYGMAVDFGATYRLNSDWDFALAFNDIGFINWKSNVEATTNGDRIVSTRDYPLNPSEFEDSFDDFTNAISGLYQLDDNGDTGSRCRAIAGTMKASARYSLPMYRRLSFGLLNTTHMQKRFAWTEFRLSANLTPVDWLGLGVNYGLGTFGSSFGWILNIAPKGFNLYVGMDHTIGKLSKRYVPLNLNSQLSLGLNFPF